MRPKAVAFDLGGTLVRYYEREEFPAILAQALEGVHSLLAPWASVPLAQAQQTAMAQNVELPDAQVRPLTERLAHLFGYPQPWPTPLSDAVARAFLKPIFACARVYDDTAPALCHLRQQGYRLAIVSNTPWGTPSGPWREEIQRLGLAQAVDAALFCVDVGWRKPARPIFQATAKALGVEAGECVFVGDEPRWDIEGARGAEMVPVLMDRTGRHAGHGGWLVHRLAELPTVLRCL